ncbi:MAG: uroporphyrinogen decarboxylase family protein [Candidatus Humimicrobiaceae bacterium]
MRSELTSKERMLGAINYSEVDYIPCEFMLFFNLTNKFKRQDKAIEEELKMGLDAVVNVGTLKHSFHPDTQYSEWIEKKDGNKYFYRKLETPEGPLTQKVIQRNNWPTEDFFPIFDDYIIPRAKEVFLNAEKDLDKLKYLLGPFSKENIEKLKSQASEAKKIADKHGLLQIAGEMCRNLFNEGNYSLISGADMMSWLSGFENIMTLSLAKPEFVKEYVSIISEWNRRQIEIYLDITDVDLIVRRAWYETTEFWTPDAYKKIIFPNIKKEAELVHQAGKKYGYIMTSAFMPIVDDILDTGIDVLIGLDPKEGKGTEMDIVKEKFLIRKKALWGGVSGPVTLEDGTAGETEEAVMEAIKTLGRGGGFILSPVDNVREETGNVWANTYKFIETWKKYRNMF